MAYGIMGVVYEQIDGLQFFHYNNANYFNTGVQHFIYPNIHTSELCHMIVDMGRDGHKVSLFMQESTKSPISGTHTEGYVGTERWVSRTHKMPHPLGHTVWLQTPT